MPSKNSQFTNEELALAYELRQEGCCWKRIALGLGCDESRLRKAYSSAVIYGFGYSAGAGQFSHELLACMSKVKRSTKLSWASLAEHIGTTGPKLRWAVKWHRANHKT